MLTGSLSRPRKILFHGENVVRDMKGFQRRMGYVAEEAHLYPHLTGREYLQLAGRLRG
jgi:ABC-2 type transport system ATP-binding protein